MKTKAYCMDCGTYDFIDESWQYCGENEDGPMYLCPSCYWDATHDNYEYDSNFDTPPDLTLQ